MKKAHEIMQEAYTDLTVGGAKVGVGVGGVFAAMTINDIAGLIVAILTAIYMVLQIESAWNKRKEAKARKHD